MKKFNYRVLPLLLTSLMMGCNQANESQEFIKEVEGKVAMQQQLPSIAIENKTILDVYTDRSAYNPGEIPKLLIELRNQNNETLVGNLKIRVRHINEVISEQEEEIVLASNEEKTMTQLVKLPEDDFSGYAVEVYLYEQEEISDYEMTAVDVSSNWNRFPRYGYLTNMATRSKEESRAVLTRLLKHHINGLFYYDVINQHDSPLAGTVEKPAESWETLAHHEASYQTVKDMIDIGHEYNMNSFIYNLIFGAYDNYGALGIKEEWGLFKDQNHKVQDAHDLSGLNWETEKIWLFDPGNEYWQTYYLKVHKEILEAFGYDGIQVDSLGGRGTLYTYEGEKVELSDRYGGVLNRLGKELDTRVIFNPVGGYGMRQQLQDGNYDTIYMEVWPGDHKTYSSLKTALDTIYRTTAGERGSIIGAYMNYEKVKRTGGSFNTAGINYTNAVLLAAGGSHLELGDTGMLSSEYYPAETLKINETLAKDLRNYYDFMVAYENLLRGTGLQEVVTRTYVEGEKTSYDSEVGRIWSFTKTKEQGENKQEMIHLINLKEAEHVEWVDGMGTQPEPMVYTNQQVKHYVTIPPYKVSIASPDYNEGIIEEIDFEVQEDDKGTYVSFELPYLEYWTMIIIE